MINVLVSCNAGMSTSLLVGKIKKEAEAQNIELEIKAVPVIEGKKLVQDNKYDLVLLGPQVSFVKRDFEKVIDGKFPVEVINMMDYGTVNAKGVLKHILEVANK